MKIENFIIGKSYRFKSLWINLEYGNLIFQGMEGENLKFNYIRDGNIEEKFWSLQYLENFTEVEVDYLQ